MLTGLQLGSKSILHTEIKAGFEYAMCSHWKSVLKTIGTQIFECAVDAH